MATAGTRNIFDPGRFQAPVITGPVESSNHPNSVSLSLEDQVWMSDDQRFTVYIVKIGQKVLLGTAAGHETADDRCLPAQRVFRLQFPCRTAIERQKRYAD
jgi:hypothetical protein